MEQAEQYDNLVLGSGEAGKYLAWHLAGLGQSTAVVERRWIGGSCPNTNCLPSKNEIFSAHVVDTARHAAAFGMPVVPAPVDMAAVRARKRRMVEDLVALHLSRFAASGAELIMGDAVFPARGTLDVRLNAGGTRRLSAGRIFINVGTHAIIPDLPGLAEAAPLTNIEVLELDRLPRHLIVLGGGFVGLEFAQAYRRFGSQVTLIERGPQILAREDPDAAAEILRILQAEGIDVLLGAQTSSVEGRSGQDVVVTARQGTGVRRISGSDILVAVGRRPNTAGIGLDRAGVDLDDSGFIRVNDRLETSAPGVWALGECAGTPQFTHAAFDDFRIVRDNMAGRERTATGRLIPSCMFTEPPLARVGLSEAEARRGGIAVRGATLAMREILRTRTTGETAGFMKVLVGASDERILGFTMIGAEAGEVMAAMQVAMLGEVPFTRVRDAILAHPTMAEGLGALLSKIPPIAHPQGADARAS